MITLSERMRSALVESGKTPAELARACDVRPPSVSAWLSGETKSLKAKSAHAAARFLGVSASWLSDGIGPRYPEGLRPAAPASTIDQPSAPENYFFRRTPDPSRNPEVCRALLDLARELERGNLNDEARKLLTAELQAKTRFVREALERMKNNER